jgi:hypothetical protein
MDDLAGDDSSRGGPRGGRGFGGEEEEGSFHFFRFDGDAFLDDGFDGDGEDGEGDDEGEEDDEDLRPARRGAPRATSSTTGTGPRGAAAFVLPSPPTTSSSSAHSFSFPRFGSLFTTTSTSTAPADPKLSSSLPYSVFAASPASSRPIAPAPVPAPALTLSAAPVPASPSIAGSSGGSRVSSSSSSPLPFGDDDFGLLGADLGDMLILPPGTGWGGAPPAPISSSSPSSSSSSSSSLSTGAAFEDPFEAALPHMSELPAPLLAPAPAVASSSFRGVGAREEVAALLPDLLRRLAHSDPRAAETLRGLLEKDSIARLLREQQDRREKKPASVASGLARSSSSSSVTVSTLGPREGGGGGGDDPSLSAPELQSKVALTIGLLASWLASNNGAAAATTTTSKSSASDDEGEGEGSGGDATDPDGDEDLARAPSRRTVHSSDGLSGLSSPDASDEEARSVGVDVRQRSGRRMVGGPAPPSLPPFAHPRHNLRASAAAASWAF